MTPTAIFLMGFALGIFVAAMAVLLFLIQADLRRPRLPASPSPKDVAKHLERYGRDSL